MVGISIYFYDTDAQQDKNVFFLVFQINSNMANMVKSGTKLLLEVNLIDYRYSVTGYSDYVKLKITKL